MPEVIIKPKPWATQVYDLEVNKTIYFPGPDYDYIRSLVSGLVKRKYPERVYSVSRADNVSVTRSEDKQV